jgi:protein-tyrosine phosphatase
MRILFVCMGNICRSPTAEGVMRRLVAEAGLDGAVDVQSAGIGDWHAGEPPDERAAAAAWARGITLEGSARQVRPGDFRRFDLLIAMDRGNVRELLALAPDEEAAEKVRLLREFDPTAAGTPDLDVPDPYYGGERGFETVLDMIEAACRGLLDELRAAGRA